MHVAQVRSGEGSAKRGWRARRTPRQPQGRASQGLARNIQCTRPIHAAQRTQVRQLTPIRTSTGTGNSRGANGACPPSPGWLELLSRLSLRAGNARCSGASICSRVLLGPAAQSVGQKEPRSVSPMGRQVGALCFVPALVLIVAGRLAQAAPVRSVLTLRGHKADPQAIEFTTRDGACDVTDPAGSACGFTMQRVPAYSASEPESLSIAHGDKERVRIESDVVEVAGKVSAGEFAATGNVTAASAALSDKLTVRGVDVLDVVTALETEVRALSEALKARPTTLKGLVESSQCFAAAGYMDAGYNRAFRVHAATTDSGEYVAPADVTKALAHSCTPFYQRYGSHGSGHTHHYFAECVLTCPASHPLAILAGCFWQGPGGSRHPGTGGAWTPLAKDGKVGNSNEVRCRIPFGFSILDDAGIRAKFPHIGQYDITNSDLKLADANAYLNGHLYAHCCK